jgi:hypothetical protein
MKERRKFTFVGQKGIRCDQQCFGIGFGQKSFRETSTDYQVPGSSFYPVSECTAPGAPGKNSKLGRHRICVMGDSGAQQFCENNSIELRPLIINLDE